MLEKLDLDMSRVHFTGMLPYPEYLKLLQITSAHVYLTFPFVLSWSLIESMAVECPIIASNTAPVQEVIKDGKTGVLTEFFDVNALLEKVEYMLDNPSKFKDMRKKARKHVLKNYALKNLLPRQIQIINSVANMYKK